MKPFMYTSKLMICLFFCSTFVLSSCKDDDDTIIDKANLAGDTWNYDHADVGNAIASALIDAFMDGSTYKFNNDNTYSSVVIGIESDGTWEFSNSKITLNAGTDLEEVWEVTELSPTSLVYIGTTIDDATEEETTTTFFYTR